MDVGAGSPQEPRMGINKGTAIAAKGRAGEKREPEQHPDTSLKATLWMKAQREGALTPLCIIRKLKSLLQHHSSKVSILQLSAFFIVQLSHPYMTTGAP